MNEESGIPAADKRSSLAAGIATRAGTVAFFITLQRVILFLAAGRLSWMWAWLYLGICLASVAINGAIMLRTGLETIAERGRPQATQNWDKIIYREYTQPVRYRLIPGVW